MSSGAPLDYVSEMAPLDRSLGHAKLYVGRSRSRGRGSCRLRLPYAAVAPCAAALSVLALMSCDLTARTVSELMW